ncbi:putative bifunctional diguanylate cyclase/phosphodiesterase [Arthrobacter monumenti]
MEQFVSDPRLDKLVDGIVRLSSGDLTARLEISPARDSIDAVISGVNLLAEELNVMYQDLEKRVEERTAMLREAQVELQRMAMTDNLTGLANRALLSERMSREVQAAVDSGKPPALIFLDLDTFKDVNDSLGHAAGDRVLVEVARRLKGVVRTTDTVARLGGDEFALLLPETDEAQARAVAERTLEALRPAIIVAGTRIWTMASIGVRCGEDGHNAETLMQDADAAMYAAKSGGKGIVRVFDPSILDAARQRSRLTSELRHGIEAHQLLVHYQPVVGLGSGKITGAEALVRWQHPERGLLYPDDFVSVAEETGLIAELGQWMIQTAVHQLAAWKDMLSGRPFALRVNLSAMEMREPDLAGFIAAALAASDVPPSKLIVEITETVLMTGDVVSSENLRQLNRLGVGVEIDDFGTGYSSISYLRELPADTVKMDRSLIAEIANDPEQKIFVAAVLQLISAAGLTAVAEGIETAGQADQLRRLDCLYGQGRYFSPPVTADAMTGMLSSRGYLRTPGTGND